MNIFLRIFAAPPFCTSKGVTCTASEESRRSWMGGPCTARKSISSIGNVWAGMRLQTCLSPGSTLRRLYQPAGSSSTWSGVPRIWSASTSRSSNLTFSPIPALWWWIGPLPACSLTLMLNPLAGYSICRKICVCSYSGTFRRGTMSLSTFLICHMASI